MLIRFRKKYSHDKTKKRKIKIKSRLVVILERGDGNFLFLKLGDTFVYFIIVLNTVSSPQG